MSVPGTVNADADEAKGTDDELPPTGLLTPAMVQDGLELELKLAGLDDEDDGIEHAPKRVEKPADYLVKKTPEEVFEEFDVDGSGYIDLEEFQAMVKALGFNITEAKALKYFRHIDEDGSGEIEMDEFRVALFMLDPVTGNTLGFQPSKLLTPSDAFEKFDTDRSGNIDEDEFFFALEYLGLKVSDAKQEKLFKKYDRDNSGTIDYDEFKDIWLHNNNVRQELINRGIEVTRWMTKAYMRKRLSEIVDEEELAEQKTLKLAKQWAAWKQEMQDKEKDLAAARVRANNELATALDVGGQVYMFGRGVSRQFAAKPVRPDLLGFDRIKTMWRERLNLDERGDAPDDDDDDSSSDGASTSSDGSSVSSASSTASSHLHIPSVNQRRRASVISQHSASSAVSRISRASSRSRATTASSASGGSHDSHPALVGKRMDIGQVGGVIDADLDEWEVAKFNLNPYLGLVMAYNTAPLWGRRVREVSFGQATAFARTDMGEMYVWGGKARWWSEFQPESKWVKRKVKPGKLTERSDWQMTMGTVDNVIIDNKRTRAIKDESFQGDGPQVKKKKKKKSKKKKSKKKKKHKNRRADSEALEAVAEASDESGSDADAKGEEEEKGGPVELKENPDMLVTMDGGGILDLYNIDPYELDEEQENKLKHELRRKRKARDDDHKADILKSVTQYYGVWEPAPTAAHRLPFLENVLLPKVTFDQLQNSLKLRGKILGSHTKSELVTMLGDCLRVEMLELDDDTVKKVRETERAIEAYMVRNQPKRARKLKAELLAIWEPLLVIQEAGKAEAEKKAKEALLLNERRFEDAYLKEKINRAACMQEKRKYFTPRGTHPYMAVGGLTYRGPRLNTFRGGSAVRCIGVGAHHVIVIHEDGQTFAWGVGDAGRLGFGSGPDGAEGGEVAAGFPTLIPGLKHTRMLACACGYAHNVAVSRGGQLYAWGSAMHGQLGLGEVDKVKFDLFCPRPTPIRMPGSVLFHKVACGATYSAAITTEGHLWVWGNADSGKLGIGLVRGDVPVPTLVEDLARRNVRVHKISCGTSHSILCTRIVDVWTGGEHNRLHSFAGGDVYMCGSSAALGKSYRTWTYVEELGPHHVSDVAAGYSHSAACTVDGELYTWGANKDGCCGQTLENTFIMRPSLVKCMYVKPKNIAANAHSVVTQSSVYNGLGPETAIDGDNSGDGEWTCAHTQRDKQSWWQLDLGQNASMEKIVLWNRNDVPFDQSQPKDAITKRLFPCWVIVSQHEFGPDLGINLSRCLYKRRLKENQRRSVVTLPQATVARFVMIQLEGENYLHFSQLEVYGTYGDYYKVGRVTNVAATHAATIVSMGPVIEEHDIMNAYKRAVRADSANAVILRQFPMYYKYFDEYGRGESMPGSCPCCTVETKCEMCILEEKWGVDDIEPGPLGRLRRLESMKDVLLGVAQPELEWDEPDPPAPTFGEMVNKKVKAAAALLRSIRRAKAVKAWGKVRTGLQAVKSFRGGPETDEDGKEGMVVNTGGQFILSTKRVYKEPTPRLLSEVAHRSGAAESLTPRTPRTPHTARSTRSARSVLSRPGTALSSGLRSVLGRKKKKKARQTARQIRRQKERAWDDAIPLSEPKMPMLGYKRRTGLTPRGGRPGTAGSASSRGSGSSYDGSSRGGSRAPSRGRTPGSVASGAGGAGAGARSGRSR